MHYNILDEAKTMLKLFTKVPILFESGFSFEEVSQE